MVRKSTYILLIILLVLAAIVVFLQRAPGLTAGPADLPTSTPSKLLIEWSNRSISSFKMADEQGHVLNATLGSDKNWHIDLPSGCAADSNTIASAISQLTTLKVAVDLKAPPALADVGLSTPSRSLRITMSDGSIQSLSIGSVVPTGTGYYVQLDKNPVVVVTKSSIDSIFSILETACATATPEATEPGTELATSTPEQ